MKISGAHEDHEGYVTVLVTFEDGATQTVRLPNWAKHEHFVAEATRMRRVADAQHKHHRARHDLNDE